MLYTDHKKVIIVDGHTWLKNERVVHVKRGVLYHIEISFLLFQLWLVWSVRQLLNVQHYWVIQSVHHHSVRARMDILEILAQVC